MTSNTENSDKFERGADTVVVETKHVSPAPSQHLADGSVLSPQPSTSPDDPLNWSWAKKHAVLVALLPGCMLSDW